MTDHAVTLAPQGPVTLATVNRLFVDFSSSSRSQPIILDLVKAGPFDSSALALVATIKRRAVSQGVSFTLKNVPDSLRSLAQIYDLENFIESCAQ